MYAIQVNNGEYTYLLGMYLGNIKKDEVIDPFKNYHPTLGKAIIFKNLQQASSIADGLNISQNSESFKVIETNPEDVSHRIRYQW